VNNLQIIRARVEALIAINASEQAALALLGECKLDEAIARRNQDEEAEATAKAARERATTAWYGYYVERMDAAVALCEALGVSPDMLKSAL
jgi:hypothetical protein